MGCAPPSGPRLHLSARQSRLLGRVARRPGATTAELTSRWSNPAVTRVDLAALVDASLVVPVTSIDVTYRENSGVTVGVSGPGGHHLSTSTMRVVTYFTDRDEARNGVLRWRTTLPGDRLDERGSLADIGVGSRGARLADWWLCPRGARMRTEALARLRDGEAPLGELAAVERARDDALFELTAVASECRASELLEQRWPELSGATANDALATGVPPGRVVAAARARAERHRAEADARHRSRVGAADAATAQLLSSAARVRDRFAPRQGFCCGTVVFRSVALSVR